MQRVFKERSSFITRVQVAAAAGAPAPATPEPARAGREGAHSPGQGSSLAPAPTAAGACYPAAAAGGHVPCVKAPSMCHV